MDSLFILGCIIVIIFITYNIVCYKNKKTVYTLKDKYIVLADKYYAVQLIFGLVNSFSLLVFYLVWNGTDKNQTIYLMSTLAIFWGLNYTLGFYSKVKGYIAIKKQS